jgi:hypothetical protein
MASIKNATTKTRKHEDGLASGTWAQLIETSSSVICACSFGHQRGGGRTFESRSCY